MCVGYGNEIVRLVDFGLILIICEYGESVCSVLFFRYVLSLRYLSSVISVNMVLIVYIGILCFNWCVIWFGSG